MNFNFRTPEEMQKQDEIRTPIFFKLGRQEAIKIKKIAKASNISTNALLRNVVEDYLHYLDMKNDN